MVDQLQLRCRVGCAAYAQALMQRSGSVLTTKDDYSKRCCARCNAEALERIRNHTEMHDTELIALLERAALNAVV